MVRMSSQKSRTVLSLDSVLAEAVLALDEMGDQGLSLRGSPAGSTRASRASTGTSRARAI